MLGIHFRGPCIWIRYYPNRIRIRTNDQKSDNEFVLVQEISYKQIYFIDAPVKLLQGYCRQHVHVYYLSECGQTLLEAKGTFASPIFDNKIEHSREHEPIHCQWRIVAPQGHRVRLNVTSFNIPESPNCSGDDYLEVRDGHYVKSSLIGTRRN